MGELIDYLLIAYAAVYVAFLAQLAVLIFDWYMSRPAEDDRKETLREGRLWKP